MRLRKKTRRIGRNGLSLTLALSLLLQAWPTTASASAGTGTNWQSVNDALEQALKEGIPWKDLIASVENGTNSGNPDGAAPEGSQEPPSQPGDVNGAPPAGEPPSTGDIPPSGEAPTAEEPQPTDEAPPPEEAKPALQDPLAKLQLSADSGDVIVRFKDAASLKAGKSDAPERVQLVQVEPGTDAQDVIAELKQDPRVIYAEPNYKLSAQTLSPDITPKDDHYKDQWALNPDQLNAAPAWDSALSQLFQNAEAGGANAYDLNDNGAFDAGDDVAGLVSQTAAQVTVAVVDTGVDASHEDLSGKVLPGYNAITNVEGDAPDDSSTGHGTQMAGIIAANVSNKWGAADTHGIAGVAGNFPVKILPVKALDPAGVGTVFNIARGIKWAADHGANVINLSLGARLPDYPQTLADAVQYAIDKGVVVIAAAGNESGYIDNFYPAALPSVVSVVASGRDHLPAAFSNMNGRISAPGVDIWSTLPGNEYGKGSGTSQAAAYASGAAAFYRSIHPDVSVEEVADALYSGQASYPVSCDRYYGCVDYYRVLSMSNMLTETGGPWVQTQFLEPSTSQYDDPVILSGQTRAVVKVDNIAYTDKVTLSLVADPGYYSGGEVIKVLGEVPREDIPESGVITFNWDTTEFEDGMYGLSAVQYFTDPNYPDQPSQTSDYRVIDIANHASGGLTIEVDEPDGSPAAGARIAVSHRVEETDGETGSKYAYYEDIWSGQADAQGKVQLSAKDVISGNDFLVTARGSSPDFFYSRIVRAPGNVLFKAEDAQLVTFSGQQTDGKPLDGALVLFDLLDQDTGELVNYDSYTQDYSLTTLNAQGESEVYLSRGKYNFRLVDEDSAYYLIQKNIAISGDNHQIDFHPAAGEVSTVSLSSDDFTSGSFLLREEQYGSFIGIQGNTAGLTMTVTPGVYYGQIEAVVPDTANNRDYIWTLETQPLQLEPGKSANIQYGSPIEGTISNDPNYYGDGHWTQGGPAYFDLDFVDQHGNKTTDLSWQTASSQASGSGAGSSVIVRSMTETPKDTSKEPSAASDTYIFKPDSKQFELSSQAATQILPTLEVLDSKGNLARGSQFAYSTTNAYWDIPYDLPAGDYTARASLASGPLSGTPSKRTVTPTITAQVREWEEQPPADADLAVTVLDRAGSPMQGAYVDLVGYDGGSMQEVSSSSANDEGVASFDNLNLVPGGSYGLLITGWVPGDDDGGGLDPMLWFEPLAYDGSPASVVASAADLHWNRVSLKAADRNGQEFPVDEMVSFRVTGHDDSGLAYDSTFEDVQYDDLSDTQTIWLPDGDYTFQAYTEQRSAYGFQASEDSEDSGEPAEGDQIYLLTKQVDLPSQLPANGTIVLGGADLARLDFAPPASSGGQPAYLIPAAALFYEGVPSAPIFIPQYIGSEYDDEGNAGPAQAIHREFYVTPGSYTAQAVLVHHRYDADWDYWLEKSLTLEPDSTFTWEMDDSFSSKITMDQQSYGQAGHVLFTNEIRDSHGNRLTAAAIDAIGMDYGGDVPRLASSQDGDVSAQNHDEIAPFITIDDASGKEVAHFKEAGVNDDIIKNLWTQRSYDEPNRVPLLTEDSTFYGADYALPMDLPAGAYQATLTFSDGPHTFKPSETAFSVDVGIAAPTLDPLAAQTNANQLEVAGTARPGSQVAIRYRVGDGAAVEAGSAVADTDTGRFSATIDLPQEGTYTITATASSGGMTSVDSSPRTVVVDRTPPGAPRGLAGVSEDLSSIRLAWQAPANESAVRYEVKRGGTVLADALEDAAYLDRDLTADTEYAYEVTAVDQAGNRSAPATVTVRTLASLELKITNVRWQGERDAHGLIAHEGELRFILSGTPGVTASALVTYDVIGNEEPVTHTAALTEDKDAQGKGLGIYRGSYKLPPEAAMLESIAGKLEADGAAPVTQEATGLPQPLSGSLDVTVEVDQGEDSGASNDASNAALNGGYISAWSNTANSGGTVDLTGEGTFELTDLAPADDYVIRIYGAKNLLLKQQTGVSVRSGIRNEVRVTTKVPVPLLVQVLDESGDPAANIGVILSTPERSGITSGYSRSNGWVTNSWYSDVDPSTPFYDQLLSGTDLIVTVKVTDQYLPIDPIALKLVPGMAPIQITLPQRPVATLQGTITTNNEAKLDGAAITAYQTIDGRDIVRTAQTDENGHYSLELYAGLDVRLYINHRLAGSKSVALDTPLNPNENQQYDLKMPIQKALYLKVYTQEIDQPAFEMDMDWRVAVHLHLDIRNKGRADHPKNTYLSYLNNGLSQVSIPDGEPGDLIEITADGYEAGLGKDSIQVVLNEEAWGTAEIHLIEKGQARATVRDALGQAQDGKERWVDAYRQDGSVKTWVGTYSSKSEELETANLPDGSYTLVYHWENTGYYWGYTALLQRLGDKAVVRENVQIREGKLADLGSIALPTSSSDAAGYFQGREGNEFTSGKYEVGPGQTVTLRAGYKYAGSQALGDLTFQLGIPEGASLVAGSVAVHPVQGPTEAEITEPSGSSGSSGQVTVSFGNTAPGPVEGSIVYQVKVPEHSDWPTVAAEAWAQFTAAGAQKREKLGLVSLEVPYVTITAPSTVWTRQVQVSGRAPAGANVQIYDSSYLLADTTASSSGLWQTTVTLPDRGTPSYHSLRAQVAAEGGGDPVESTDATVVFDPDRPHITSVTMKQQDGRSINFAPGSKFTYVFVPGFTFNFNVSFNDSSRVSNLRISSDNGARAGGGTASPTAMISTSLPSSSSGYSSTPGRIYASYDVAPKPYSSVGILPIDPAKVRASMTDPWRDAKVDQIDYDDGNPDTEETSTEILIGGNPHMRLNTKIAVSSLNYTPTKAEVDAVAAGGAPVYGFSIESQIVGNNLEYSIKAIIPDSELDPGQIGTQGLETPAKLAWIFGTTAVDGGLALSDLYGTISGAASFAEFGDKVDKALAACSKDSFMYPVYRDSAQRIKDKAKTNFIINNLVQLSFTAVGAFAGFGIGGAIGLSVANMIIGTAIDASKDIMLKNFINDIKNDPFCKDDDDDNKKELIADPTWIIDPSGYVYEAVPDNRLEGVNATILQQDGDDWVVWDASQFEQDNPVTTDSQGRYGWNVPEGTWKVSYEKDGYEPGTSDALPVPPPQLEVNVGLVSLAQPQVTNVKAKESGIDITFDKYMIVPTVAAGTSAVKIYDPDAKDDFGFPVELEGSVTPVDAQVEPGKDVPLARTFRFTPNEPLKLGDSYRVWVGQMAQSYAGQPMRADYTQVVTVTSGVVPNVTGARIAAGNRQLELAWSDPQGAALEHVQISWRKQGEAAYGAPVKVKPGIGTYTLANLDNGALYEVQLVAVDAAGDESSGVTVTGTPKGTAQPPSDGGGGGGGGGGPVPTEPTEPTEPANEQTVTVGAGAQSYAIFNGEAVLVIPEGAVPAGTKLLVRKVPVTGLDEGYTLYGAGYEISALGDTPPPLLQPIELRIKPASGQTVPDWRKVGIYHRENGDWTYLASVAHPTAGTVTASVGDWGTFAVLGYSRSFDDLNGHWSRDAVEVLTSRHIVDGVDDRHYMPNRTITRAEIAKLLAELYKSAAGGELPAVDAKQRFTDVPANAWYFSYVQAAAAYGLVQGSAGKFRPNDPVTREELAVMIGNLLSQLKRTGNSDADAEADSPLPFKDASAISSWALQAVQQAYAAGLMTGVSKDEFVPKAKTTRGEVATVLLRILEKLGMLTGE